MRWHTVETDLKMTIKNLTPHANDENTDPFMRVQYQAVINFCEYLLKDNDDTMRWIHGSTPTTRKEK